MRVSVLDSRKIIYEGNAREVILPCEDGEMGILDFHQPFLCSLKAGSLLISSELEGQPTKVPVKKGIAKMEENSLVILIGGLEIKDKPV